MKHRPDIEGLRGVSVLAVVVFHAFPSLLPSGFIGVDVFFVISGFLITGILLAEHNEGQFSFLHFYARRIRRLFPALALLLLACLVAGWFVLFADEFRRLGRHAVGGAAFAANIVFLREGGYFDTASELKPLLHLWSLGIEEQFYLVWPPLLALMLWLRMRLLRWVTCLALVSFALSIWHGGTRAAFFLPHTRFWELLAGALLMIVHARRPAQRDTSLAGLALLTAGLIGIDESTPFPGVWALLPVAGTVLLLAAGPDGTVNRLILSRGALVGIGRISYPLYLWHWPLLAFGRIYYSDQPQVEIRAALILVSFAAAYATYRAIERPVRSAPPGLLLPAALCLAIGIIAGLGFIVLRQRGLPARHGIIATDLVYNHNNYGYSRCDPTLGNTAPPLEYCFQSSTGAPERAVLGDSHADALFAGIAALDAGTPWLLAGHPACPPVSGINVQLNVAHCQERSEHALDYVLATPSIHTVIITYFSAYTQDTDLAAQFGASNAVITPWPPGLTKSEVFYQALERSVAALERAGKRVVVVEDVPELPFVPRTCLQRTSLLPPARASCEVSLASVIERQRGPRQLIEDLAKAHPRLLIFDPLQVLCTADRCPTERDGRLLYRDAHHLSAWGSAQVARTFLAWLQLHGL